MRVNARGLSFDVRAAGATDGPPVLLLHGFPQHAGEWDLVTPALAAAGLRTYAVDQRGYSPGARPDDAAETGVARPYATSEFELDAVSIMDELGVDSAYVVGHDVGSLVGWHLAVHHPERVRALVAISVPHPLAMAYALANDPDQRERSSYVRLFRQPGKAEEVLLADGERRLRGMLAGVPAERVDGYVRPMTEPGALTGALGWYRALSQDDAAGVGPATVPTTFIWGDDDVAIGPTAAADCGRHVSADYRFVPLAGVSHWIPDEAPQKVIDELMLYAA